MKTNKILFTLLFIVISRSLMGTPPPTDVIKFDVAPPGPNASSLGKYGDFPVSLFSGTPNISIPLFEIKEGDITIPITLTYNAGGIRVDEVASWVGLGWSLNAGGVFSRTVRGKPDEDPNGFIHIMSDGSATAEKNLIASTSIPQTENTLNRLFGDFTTGQYADWSPDIFNYNFGDYSGKCNVGYSPLDINIGSVPMYSNFQDGLSIKFLPGGDLTTEGSGISVIDKKGIQYNFLDAEMTQELRSTYLSGIAYPYTSACYLSTINSADNKHSISFQYNNDLINYNYALGESQTCDGGTLANLDLYTCNLNNSSVPACNASHGTYQNFSVCENIITTPLHQAITQKLLNKIISDKYIIEFNPSSIGSLNIASTEYERADLGGYTNTAKSKLLKYIAIYTNTGSSSTPQKGNLYKVFRLDYDYYQSNRLRLIGLTELENDPTTWNTGSNRPKYTFTYNNNVLPARLSFAKDHWGYYNGKDNNTTLISETFFPETGAWLPGSDRNTYPDKVTQGMLSSIQYPTGGRTDFTFECNQAKYVDDPIFYKLHSNSNTSGATQRMASVTAHGNDACSAVEENMIGAIDMPAEYNLSPYDNCDPWPNGVGVAPITSNKISFFSTQYIQPAVYSLYDPTTQITTWYNTKVSVNFSGQYMGHQYAGVLLIKNGDAAHPIVAKGYVVSPNGGDVIYLNLDNNSNYTLFAYARGTNGGNLINTISADVNWQDFPTSQQTSQAVLNMYVGGARIKEIRNYTDNTTTTPSTIKQYSYLDEDNTTSSGRLYSIPSYYRIVENSYPYNSSTSPDNWTLATCVYTCRHISRFPNSLYLTSDINGAFIGYGRVVEKNIDLTNNDNGYIENKFTLSEFGDPSPIHTNTIDQGILNYETAAKGKLNSQRFYKRNTGGVYSLTKTLNFSYTEMYDSYVDSWAVNITNPGLIQLTGLLSLDTRFNGLKCFPYRMISRYLPLTKKTEVDYDDAGNAQTTITDNSYENGVHLEQTKEKQTLADNTVITTSYKYPLDVVIASTTASGTNSEFDGLVALKDKHILNSIVEKKIERGTTAGNDNKVMFAQYVSYDKQKFLPNQLLTLESNAPLNDYTSPTLSSGTITKDNRLKLKAQYNYDSEDNISEVKSVDKVTTSYLWGYNKKEVIAQVSNASTEEINYAGFETSETGFIHTPTNIVLQNVAGGDKSKTGNYYYNLTPTAPISKGVLQNRPYTLSFWYKGSVQPTVTVTNTTITAVPETTTDADGWRYVECWINTNGQSGNVATISIPSGSVKIDEVRMYPQQAQMTTYTYNANKQLWQVIDVNNRISTYEYDNFQRLSLIRDDDGKILKTVKYNYRPQ